MIDSILITDYLETDLRRLEFIANWFEDIILTELKDFETNSTESVDLNETFLRDLLDYRKFNMEMCNMILVLLTVNI